MKFIKNHFVIFIMILLSFGMSHAAGLRAAAAVRIVTPDPLLPVSGGVGPSSPVTEKKGDLSVRALVLEKDGTTVAMVSADFLGFPAALGDRVRAMVQAVPAENILIGVTHTHSAPDCYGFPDQNGQLSIDMNYMDLICRRMAEAINEAVTRLQPADLKIATGEPKGQIAYNAYAEALFDPRCGVIQALDKNGSAIATLINYAIHPEVLGSDAGILSPDLCGPLYGRIAQKGGGTAIFFNSAQGGMVTADNRGPDGKDRGTWSECTRIGELLADEALRIVDAASLQINPTLLCTSRVIQFPVDSQLLRAVIQASPLPYDKGATLVNTRINLVNVGDAQILTIPGEALPNIGFYLKRKMNGNHRLLFGLTNDAFGYILAKEDWSSCKRYDYISRTCLGEMTGEIFTTEALKLVAQSPAPAK